MPAKVGYGKGVPMGADLSDGPKGKAPTWNQFGGGVWATDLGYSFKILVLYDTLLAPLGKPLA